MPSGKARIAGRSMHQWGHIAFIASLLLGMALYFWDVWRASSSLGNLIFILPATALCGIILVAVAIVELRNNGGESALDDEEEGDGGGNRALLYSIASFIGYVLLLPYLGFDVGTFLFVAIVVLILGERRLVFSLAYAFCFTLLTVLGLKAIVPTPIYTLLL